MIYRIVFIFLVCVCCLLGCDKPPICDFTVKNLNVTVNLEGLKDTLNLNDTLWVTISIPKFIMDNDSQRFELTGELFGEFAMSLRSITEFDLISELPNFEYINDVGIFHYSPDSPFAFLQFVESDDIHQIRYGIVPLVRGTYLVDFPVILFDSNLSFLQEGTNCIHGINYIFTTSSSIPDNNYSIVAAGTVPEWLPPNYTLEGFQKDGGFAFVVKE